MDYAKVLVQFYSDKAWICGDTYESIIWNNQTSEKPTQEKLNDLYEFLLVDEMREKRNQLLKDSDFRVIIDYDYPTKDLWITYRQALRDFPEIWVKHMEFPEMPI